MKYGNPFSLATMLLSILLLTNCTSNNQTLDVKRSKTVIMHIGADPQGLNPITTVGATARYIQGLIFDKILDLDYETYMLRPTVSDSLPSVSDDHKTVTFHLRDDVAFSDGTPMTSEDVVFSFKALMNPFVDAAPLRAELHAFIDCKATDENTVVFEMSESGPFNMNRLAVNFYILPRHVYDPENISAGYTSRQATLAGEDKALVDALALDKMKTFAVQFADEKYTRQQGFIVGSGRYVFDGWETGQMIRLLKNANYWNKSSGYAFDRQNMDTIIYKTIMDTETALTAMKSGDIDFSDNFTPQQIQEQFAGESMEANFKTKIIPYPYYEVISWNEHIKDHPEKVFFQDQKVRQAMSHLVNIDEIIDKVLYGTGTPITSMVYYKRPEYNEALEVIAYNRDKANALLDEAGWKDSDNDGIRDKVVNGKKVDFKFTMYYKQGHKVRQNIALILKENFSKSGIRMDLAGLDWSIFLEKAKNHELDAWIIGWVYDSDEQDFYALLHSTQKADGYNWSSYSNPRADSLMEAIRKEWNTEKRFAMHEEIQQVLYDDQPYTLLFANTAKIAYNKRIDTDNWYGQRPCYDIPQFYLTTQNIAVK